MDGGKYGMSSSDSEESDLDILEDTAEVGVGSVWATLKSLGALVLSTWAIVYLFAFGWVLIQTRTLFLWLCPTMIELAVSGHRLNIEFNPS